VVLAIDEKTGIQAVERKGPGRPPAPGRVRREEFEYIRHGTQALIAALDVHTGISLITCGERRTQEDLRAFMAKVALAHPQRVIHVVWDNLNTHLPAQWEDFNQTHRGRFQFHFTPIHASWVNQAELLFSIYARKCLRHASLGRAPISWTTRRG
jgi:transposase